MRRILKKVFKINYTSRKESTSTFLFRPAASVEETEAVECVSEERALLAFLVFLENVGPGAILVGLNEETMGVLLRMFEDKHKAKFQNLVFGFTWWKRILYNTKTKQK